MVLDTKWFIEFDGAKQFGALGEYFSGEPGRVRLTELLNLDKDDLKPFGNGLIAEDAPDTIKQSIESITWGTRAYIQFQDILDLRLSRPEIDQVFHRNYCYYESLVYLRESLASLLDKNLLASITLLRPFLELAVSHVYWYIRSESKGYDRYYSWLRGDDKYKVSFGNMISYIFEHLPSKAYLERTRLDALKQVIRNLYRSLCSFNHTPQLCESFTAFSGNSSKISYQVLLYVLYTYEIILKQVVYLYIIAYPMALFPVNRFEKWGFNGPVGLFFDRCNFAILQKFIGNESLEKLKASMREMDNVKSLLEWFDSFPVLSEDEVENSWKDFASRVDAKTGLGSDIGRKIAFFNAHIRSLGWSMSYLNVNRQTDDTPDEIVGKLLGLT